MPKIAGGTVPERRVFAERNLDRMRRILMWEPRGHADMYGGWLGPPLRDDSDLSVLFLHNAGFSTMCGHGIIALGKVLVETGVVKATEPETILRIDTPAGQVAASAIVRDGHVDRVVFRNVDSFVVELDESVQVPELGHVSYDLAFGGAFYAYVDARAVGIDLGDTSQLVAAGRAIKQAVASAREIPHPEDPTLGFLYGVVFIDAARDASNDHRSVCVFAEGEIDRSPTGTGVSGSLAIKHRRGQIGLGGSITVESIVGSVFTGRVASETRLGGFPSIVPEISGTAHLIGRSELWVDPEDPLGNGFFLR